MTPNIMIEPEATLQFKQGYKEGFEAGKASIKNELKRLIKTLSNKEDYVTSSETISYNIKFKK